MKKLIALTVLLFSFTLFAEENGQYLYWMVDLGEDESEYEFFYATVSANGNLLTNYKGGEYQGPYVGASSLPDKGMSTEAYYAYDVSSYLDSTFVFELFNEENETVAWKRVSGADLAAFIGDTMSTASPYIVTDVIPEPTSGLLFLLGLAGLALRRRRV